MTPRSNEQSVGPGLWDYLVHKLGKLKIALGKDRFPLLIAKELEKMRWYY